MTLKHPSVLLVAAALVCVGAITGLTAAHDAVPVILNYLATAFATGAGVALPTGTPPAA